MNSFFYTLIFMLTSIPFVHAQMSVANTVFEKRPSYILSDLKFEVVNGPGLNNYIKVSDPRRVLGCVAAEPSRLSRMEKKFQELQPYFNEYQNAEVVVVVDRKYGQEMGGVSSPQCENLLPLKIILINK